MIKLLVTGFEPFDKEPVNPAWEAVKFLEGQTAGRLRIVTASVPVVAVKCFERVREAIEQHDPAAVMLVGQAGGRFALTPERVAINIDSFRIPDNEGNRPIEQPIEPDGPVAYWGTLPFVKMAEAARKEGIPAVVSDTAGTFVCNHIFYRLMHYIATRRPDIKGGYVHVPFIPQQVVEKPNQPSLSLEDIRRGLLAMAVEIDRILP